VIGSDDPTGTFTGIQGMSVSVSVDDADEARRVLERWPTADRSRRR
jgi:hypothetical protein